MIVLPTFEESALEQTYLQFTDVLAFTDKEKWITGEIGLFLNSLNLLDLNKLSFNLKYSNRGGINQLFQSGLSEWDRRLNQSTDESHNFLSPTLGIQTDYNDNFREKLLLSVSATPYAYDIKPLSLLPHNDRNVVVRCLAEIRAIFLYNPNVNDLTDFAGYRVEIYEYLKEFLPDEVIAAGINSIENYLDENQAELEFYSIEDMEEFLDDFCEYMKPFPKWVSELDNGIGKEDPFKALSRLKRLIGKSHHDDVVEFLNKTINSITDYLNHFPDKKSWSDFINQCHDLKGIRI
ncbi:hypothetical protein [Methylophaga sp.]|jgi:hypothetical protein|uniref:hypothetical protein n=1 Tax=Methylophaga sp. TaxID=2024840 RepID=UPI00176E0A58|nr:hypothetical protein [Methylophaga sp.]HIC46586.1 hypothetical protein [Methylophaga sp.]